MKSYFIDTNYFLRLLLKDNLYEFKKVYRLFQSALEKKIKAYTSIIVIFEIYWVLSSFYKKNKKTITNILNKIIEMEFIEIENKKMLAEAISLFSRLNLDLEDCYNIAYFRNNSTDNFSSFDKKIIKFLKNG